MANLATVFPPTINAEMSTYTFAPLPRALIMQRRKLRDYGKGERDEGIRRQNINMPSSRTRGDRGQSVPWTNWPSSAFPSDSSSDPKESRASRSTLSRRQEQQRRTRTSTSSSIAPVPGRKHLQVQTELYLEELTDKVEEFDAICQTDDLVERPVAIGFISAKTGTDVATQIEDDELFDFEMESTPVLEVLVGKTVQHAIVEVIQEEDIANIKKQQRRFQHLRNAYLAGEQWFRDQEDNIADGKAIDGHVFDMIHNRMLHSWSYVSDPIEKDMERSFLPWVLDQVEDALNRSSPDSSNNGSTTSRQSPSEQEPKC